VTGDALHPGRGGRVMYDLAAIGVAAACFLFVFALLYVLGRV
jgi:hypothetical protein